MLGFYNAKTGPLEKDEHYALMVRRDSQPKQFDPSRSREDFMYEGYENTLMLVRRLVNGVQALIAIRRFQTNFNFDLRT